jgi:protocatechuate 3,4-dioxygenase, alpha subunit
VDNNPHESAKVTPPPTASQTVGPFFHLGMTYLTRDNLVPQAGSGEKITLHGRVLDGDGNAVPDALVEIWQADPAGQYHSSATRFQGFGRVATGATGEFSFTTIKPGPVPAPDGSLQAPHIVVTLFATGLLKPLLTRVYLSDRPDNAPAGHDDAILKLVPPGRRSTLMAAASTESGAKNLFEWNILMQGPGETVFFDY